MIQLFLVALLSFVLRLLPLNWLYGALKITDAERAMVATVGQRTVWDAVQTYLTHVRANIAQATAMFVERTTEERSDRYKLPGGGRLQRRGLQTQTGAIKAGGEWDTAYPLEDFGDQIAGDDVTLGYMNVQEMQNHIDTVVVRDVNTVRFEMLRALFNNTVRAFVDPRGSLNVQPLANGDSGTLYPPILGADTEATDNHYLESGYAASAITDTNNPFVTIRNEIEEHFGTEADIVVFIHTDQVAVTENLTDFDPMNDRYTQPGANTSVVANPPAVPGRIIGRTNGVWVSEWRYLPTGYMLGIALDAPRPLIERVDPAFTGLGRGLQLVSRDEIYPFQMSHWRHRFGFGVGNRLNGVVMELGTGGSYTIPTIYQ